MAGGDADPPKAGRGRSINLQLQAKDIRLNAEVITIAKII